jgi:hypothetical protein
METKLGMCHGRTGDDWVTKGAEIGFPSPGDTGRSIIYIIPSCDVWNHRLKEMVQTGQAVSPTSIFITKLLCDL